jgi:3-mercaptopropionate dioxygenase
VTLQGRFRGFIRDMDSVLDQHATDEVRLLALGSSLLKDLVRHDDWLPGKFGAVSEQGYRQYLLHLDPRERYSVVSFVWAPGQKTPIHDHTVWGMVGVMRGQELCREYGSGLALIGEHILTAGDVDLVSPRIGDIHAVCNAGDCPAVSIHVYGANIGMRRRHVYDPLTVGSREFVSGYHDAD